jgi:hypothetical protein
MSLSEQLNIDDGLVQEFFTYTYNSFKSILNTTFKKLDNDGIAKTFLVPRIVIREQGQDIHRNPTTEELSTIIECEKESLNNIGVLNKTEAKINLYKWALYKKELSKAFKKHEQTKNILYYYEAFQVTYNNEVFNEKNRLESILSQEENIKQLQEELNQLICDEAFLNAKDRNTKALQAYDEDVFELTGEKAYLNNEYRKLLQSGGKYLSGYIKLIDHTIKINPENIDE